MYTFHKFLPKEIAFGHSAVAVVNKEMHFTWQTAMCCRLDRTNKTDKFIQKFSLFEGKNMFEHVQLNTMLTLLHTHAHT